MTGTTSAKHNSRILQLAHRRSIVTLPARFIEGLILIMLVMANNVMEKPAITGSPSLKAKYDFQTAIPDGLMERW